MKNRHLFLDYLLTISDTSILGLSRVKEMDMVNVMQATNRWTQGIDYCVFKLGKHWRLADCFGNFPLFKTKKAAYEAATAFVMLHAEVD